MKTKTLIKLFLLLSLTHFAQKQNSKWYFGINAGLDFLTSPPTILNNAASTSTSIYGCSVASDTSGALLFYTNGRTVFTKTHTVMANGTALANNTTTSGPTYQNCLIVKQPGNTNLYYIFNVGMNNATGTGMCYSIVDMNLAAGMGSVTVKNAVITSTQLCGQLAGVRHCNNTDVWILTHEYNNSNFTAYLLSSAGLNTTPVISAAGYQGAIYSYMKVSSNGKKIATTWNGGFPTIFDFNSSTAVVSNSFAVPCIASNSACAGMEFSPDGTKLYGTSYINSQTQYISQWDLCAGSASAIAASQYTMASSGDSYDIRLAPNGKIYVSRQNQNFLGVINNPDASGASSNYVINGQSLGSGTCRYMLAQFISSPPTPPAFTYSANCTTLTFTTSAAALTPSSNCSSSNYNLLSQTWNFGDPASGSGNTSTSNYPSHTYSSPGTYTVKLILQYSCYSDTLQKVINVGAGPLLTLSGPGTVCAGNQAIITASAVGASSYSWSNGATTPSISVNPGVTTVYTVVGSFPTMSCNAIGMYTVTVSSPTLTISGPSQVCQGSQAVITASSQGLLTYSWSTGANTNSILVSPNVTTVYSVTAADSTNLCSSVKMYTLSVIANPTFAVSNPGPVCPGNAAIISVSSTNTLNYNWSSGQSGYSISVSPSVSTIYTVTGSNSSCSSINTVQIVVYPAPILIVTANPLLICAGEQTTLNASGALTYTWVSAGNSPVLNYGSLITSPQSTTSYSVTGALVNGCKSQSVINVQVNACTSTKEEITGNESVKLYPNPGQGFFFIEVDQKATHFVVVDALGRSILVQSIENGKGFGQLGQNAPGIYWVKVMMGAYQVSVKKLLVEQGKQ